MEKFADQVDITNRKLPDFKVNVDALSDGLKNIPTPTPLEKALESLGIKGVHSLQTTATEAQKAYDTIVASDKASQWEKDSALIKLLEAQMAKAQAMGEEIPREQVEMLEKLKASTELKLPDVEGVWKGFGTNVSTVITNFAQDISKSLWEGDMSWGEKGKALLSSLGQAVTSSFIEPATAALSSFITGVLKDLMSGKGFGGLLGQLTSIGDTITGIFKSTKGGGMGDFSQVPGFGGGGGGAGGMASGLMKGAMGWASLGTDIFEAVMGFIGDMRLEGTMNQVERNTAAASIHLLYILENLNTHLPLLWWLGDIKTTLTDLGQPLCATIRVLSGAPR